MSSQPSNAALKPLLFLDAATCLAMGLALLVLSGFVAGLTAIPEALLFYAGALLVPIGLFMAATGLRWSTSAFAVWLIIAGNVGWVIASLALLAAIPPNALGVALIVAQAVVVAVLAWAEQRAFRPAGAAD